LSSFGEGGETEGVIRHLVERGHNVVYFGRHDGELPCPAIQPYLKGIDDLVSEREQQAAWGHDIAALEPYAPFAGMVNVLGACSPRNFAGETIVYAWAIRYCGPALNLLRHFNLRRVVINNDPRSYPHEMEMGHSPNLIPVALLGQYDSDRLRVVAGTRYRVKEVHAFAESWVYNHVRENTDEQPVVFMAHAHLKDGIRVPERFDAIWDIAQWTDIPVYGAGWEGIRDDAVLLRQHVVTDMINTATCCPVIAHVPGFYTGKPYVLMSQGCIPILWGASRQDGSSSPFTADPKGLLLPLNSLWRWDEGCNPWGPKGIIQRTIDAKDMLRAKWAERLKPRWEMLDEVVDLLIRDKPIPIDRFGGFARV